MAGTPNGLLTSHGGASAPASPGGGVLPSLPGGASGDASGPLVVSSAALSVPQATTDAIAMATNAARLIPAIVSERACASAADGVMQERDVDASAARALSRIDARRA